MSFVANVPAGVRAGTSLQFYSIGPANSNTHPPTFPSKRRDPSSREGRTRSPESKLRVESVLDSLSSRLGRKGPGASTGRWVRKGPARCELGRWVVGKVGSLGGRGAHCNFISVFVSADSWLISKNRPIPSRLQGPNMARRRGKQFVDPMTRRRSPDERSCSLCRIQFSAW